jgi:hypothetical protein
MTGTTWADRQLEVTRSFVHGAVGVKDFIEQLLKARHQTVAAGEVPPGDVEDLLNDIWFAIDMHNEYDDLRAPDEFDDAQLLEVITGYLAAWDAGTWECDPRWER